MARAYKVSAALPKEDGTTVPVVKFAGSQGDASKIRIAWRADNKKLGLKKDDVTIEAIELPTDKAGLIAWLNETF